MLAPTWRCGSGAQHHASVKARAKAGTVTGPMQCGEGAWWLHTRAKLQRGPIPHLADVLVAVYLGADALPALGHLLIPHPVVLQSGCVQGGGKRAGKLALGRAGHCCACSHLCLPQQGRTQWSSGQCGPSSCHSSRRIIQPRPEEAGVRQRGGSSCGMGTLSSAMLQTSVRACVHSS